MKTKRAIIVLSQDDHTNFKTYCSSVGSNIQEICILALNEFLERKEIPITLSTPRKEAKNVKNRASKKQKEEMVSPAKE